MTQPFNVGSEVQSGTLRPRNPFFIGASALAAVLNVLRNVVPSLQPLLATTSYQLITSLVVGRWTRPRRLLADKYPPQMQLAVLFEEMSMALEERDLMSRDKGAEANRGRIRKLETEVLQLQAEIVAMNRRNLRG